MFFRVSSLFTFLFAIPLSYGTSIIEFNQVFAQNTATELTAKSVPGAAYAIVKNKNIIALETFGHIDKAKSQKINSDTVFRLASVSKTFAATVATMLAQEQRLSLSDPVTKYLPEFSLAKPGAADRIQLKHVLSHSSGLMPNAYDNLLQENWSMEKIIGRFDRIAPICKPAQCYGYQNIAYAFVQPAIESSQPKSYSALLQDRVFTPLNMKDASVGIDVFAHNKNTAKPHVLRKRVPTGKVDREGKEIKLNIWHTVPVKNDFYKVAPAAGINASITDLAKWLVANLGYQPQVLSPALLDELTTPRIKTRKDLRRRYWKDHLSDAHYGYGWRIYQFDGYPIIYHSGWVAGFRADIGYSPKLDIGFAVLLNAESNAISHISTQFWAQAHKLTTSNIKTQS